MKKIMFVLAASLMLAACGGSAEQTAQDSTVVADSVVVADTAAVVADTTAAK